MAGYAKQFPSGLVDQQTRVYHGHIEAWETAIDALKRQGARYATDYLSGGSGSFVSGSTDLTQAINDAIADLSSGGQIILPMGTSIISGAGISGSTRGIRIHGAGKGSTVLSYSGSGTALAWGNTGSAIPNMQFVLQDLSIQGTSSGAVGVDLIRFQDFLLKNVEVLGFSNGSGIRVKGSNSGTAINTDARTCSTGLRIDTSTDVSSLNSFIGGQFTGNARAIHATECDMQKWIGCNVASNTTSPAFLIEKGNNNEIDCYFENNATAGTASSIELGTASLTVWGTKIRSLFTENAGMDYLVKLTRAIGTHLENGWLGGTAGTAYVRTEANTSQTQIFSPANVSSWTLLSEGSSSTDTMIYGHGTDSLMRKTFDAMRFKDLALQMTEVSALSAPASNEAKLYCRDNGGGKTQIVAQFPTGAVQVIATEP